MQGRVDSFRFVVCPRADCRQAFFLCRHCDRGDRYGSRRCAQGARRASLQAAWRRYQHTQRGRLHHAARLHEMLRARGYPGSANQVRRYVCTIRPAARAEAFLCLDILSGEQAQVDWGNFGAYMVGHARRVLSCFVLVLSWSRAGYPGPAEPMCPEDCSLRRPPDGRPSTGGYTCAGPTGAHRLNGKRRGSGTADVYFRRGTWPTR